MKKFTGYGLVTGACLFVSGALVFQSPHSSHAANGSAIAAVSGTAGTNIANSSTVSLSPRASIQPFQFSGSIDIDDGQNGGGETLDVPPGKELVIEYFSAEADLPAGQKLLELNVTTTVGGQYGTSFVHPHVHGQFPPGVRRRYFRRERAHPVVLRQWGRFRQARGVSERD